MPPYRVYNIVVGREEKVKREEKDWALPLPGCFFRYHGSFPV